MPAMLMGIHVGRQRTGQGAISRKQVAAMLQEWDRKHPGRVDTMFTALQNVVPSHLADGTLHDFKGLTLTGMVSIEGDRAFDPEDFESPSTLLGLQVIKI